MNNNSICLVAIVKDELPFIYEWILYHKLLGVDYFFLYDDDPQLPLKNDLLMYGDFVKVIPWVEIKDENSNTLNQIQAYKHSLNYVKDYDWVGYVDIDEFIVLREHKDIKEFLNDYNDVDSVSLNWLVFGHNGHYDNPKGFVVENYTRRMREPNKNFKSITRTNKIEDIQDPHYCKLQEGSKWIDPNKISFSDSIYSTKTKIAHINHYQCRSFKTWMKRAERGDVNFNNKNSPDFEKWRLSEESLLKQFVKTIAFNKNEYIDEYMFKYVEPIKEMFNNFKKI